MNKTLLDKEQALLHLGTDISDEVAADFNQWCVGHATANLALPGFQRVRRFARKNDYVGAGKSSQYLTLYDLESTSALSRDAYPEHDQSLPDRFLPHLHFERSLYRELGVHAGSSPAATATAILHVTVDVPDPARIGAFLDWYAGIHVPAVLEVPGTVGARRYVNAEPESGGHTFCTLYEMEDASVIGRPEMPDAARKGACPAELEPHRTAANQVYEEIFRAPNAE